MAVHIKPDGEPLALFLKRITAWNNGEPVSAPDLPTGIHRFEQRDNGSWWAYCTEKGCFASPKRRHKATCPQPVLWESFGFLGLPPIT
jgi:hypothetical protein